MMTQILKTLNKIPKRRALTILAVGLIAIAAVGATIAWLTAESALMTNTFEKAMVTCEVNEEFENGVKNDVSIRNTGTMDAYIRVALIPVWRNNGNISGKAAALSDCALTWSSDYGTKWILGNDGYYYCTDPIPAGDLTPVLIDECTASSDDGDQFELQIIAQAIQALPDDAVEKAWGCTVNNGTLEVS